MFSNPAILYFVDKEIIRLLAGKSRPNEFAQFFVDADQCEIIGFLNLIYK